MLSQTDEKPVRKVPKEPPKSSEQESRAVFLSIGSKEQRITTKAFCEPQIVASQLRKRKVEVSMKNLSLDELRQLEHAKQNEIRQYLRNEVMEALNGNEEIRDDVLMGMRWVVTVKHFPEKKVKATLVIPSQRPGRRVAASGNTDTNTSCKALFPASGSTSCF